MLRSRSFLALAATAALTVGSSACTLLSSDDPIEDDDSSGVSTGVGGDDSTASTGVGGDDSATSTGAGGDPYCLDGIGTGQTTQMCEDMAISPASFGICEDGLNTLGYDACIQSFEIWEEGFAEALAECISYIPIEDACEEQPVIDCVENLYTDTCEVTYIEDTCQSWADTCAESGDTLDAAACYADLTPFSDEGLLQLTDCMNETDGTCEDRYDGCFDEVTALD
jgi:hypothetical protein